MTPDLLKTLRELLADDTDRLSEWEIKFLDDIFDRQLSGRFDLSDRQRETIERIWAKLFGGGA